MDEKDSVPVAFRYEEVTVDSGSSLLAPATKVPKKKKVQQQQQQPQAEQEPEPAVQHQQQAYPVMGDGFMPVTVDPLTNLPVTSFPAYYPGYGYAQPTTTYNYAYSAAPLEAKKRKDKKPKMLRAAGGQVWEDESLASWPKDDFRIFAGNLGNEVTDDALKRAFGHYRSAVRAKVIRDKRTGKSKGYGFVSFLDANDFVRALREMNGKYICNRPCKLTKSNWDDRNFVPEKKNRK
eukprot:TRINITY_DN1906_c0_g1_i1.p1 TRINITY_DN1906_c0_g1~~TRINITY_DN1906_c0_g1_i1.p1  ORF type:complete len:270 (-),score=65.19 TRINITY_DN1906_c0_g1_i1:49-753(-)